MPSGQAVHPHFRHLPGWAATNLNSTVSLHQRSVSCCQQANALTEGGAHGNNGKCRCLLLAC